MPSLFERNTRFSCPTNINRLNPLPKISIVTPSFNDAPFLQTAIESILDQNYPNLEYIIVDGGSTDGSVDIIKKYEKGLAYWVSEKDNGMYDAIQKGFEKTTGEIMGWINSDDMHHPGSLDMMAQIFSDCQDVNWIQGTPNIIDEKNRIVYVSPTHEVDRFHFYERRHVRSHHYIQQESTFWRRSLWVNAGGHISQQYKYAGDFDLWIRFFQQDKLFNVNALLGAFRLAGNEQASVAHYDEYVGETLKILGNYPLNDKEKRQLRCNRLQARLERRFGRLIDRTRRMFDINHESVVSNKIHFDTVARKFTLR
jgi:glycosyltransferase involved in cell wall biosynthesis